MYQQIAQHIKQQENELVNLLLDYDGTKADDLLIDALFNGTCDYLVRLGFGTIEIDYLMKDMYKIMTGE